MGEMDKQKAVDLIKIIYGEDVSSEDIVETIQGHDSWYFLVQHKLYRMKYRISFDIWDAADPKRSAEIYAYSRDLKTTQTQIVHLEQQLLDYRAKMEQIEDKLKELNDSI